MKEWEQRLKSCGRKFFSFQNDNRTGTLGMDEDKDYDTGEVYFSVWWSGAIRSKRGNILCYKWTFKSKNRAYQLIKRIQKMKNKKRSMPNFFGREGSLYSVENDMPDCKMLKVV